MGAQEEGEVPEKGRVLQEEGGNKKTQRIPWSALEEYIVLFPFNQASVGGLQ